MTTEGLPAGALVTSRFDNGKPVRVLGGPFHLNAVSWYVVAFEGEGAAGPVLRRAEGLREALTAHEVVRKSLEVYKRLATTEEVVNQLVEDLEDHFDLIRRKK